MGKKKAKKDAPPQPQKPVAPKAAATVAKVPIVHAVKPLVVKAAKVMAKKLSKAPAATRGLARSYAGRALGALRHSTLGNGESVVVPSMGAVYPGGGHAGSMAARGPVMKSGTPWHVGDEIAVAATQRFVTSLLEPWVGFQQALEGRVPDDTLRSTRTWWTKMIVNSGAVTNSANSTVDVVLVVNPTGVAHAQLCTTISGGQPTVFTDINDPSYSSWAGSLESVRMVACGVQSFNASNVLNQGGMIASGRISAGQATTTPWSVFAADADTFVRGLGNPGDVGCTLWLPRGGVGGMAPTVSGLVGDHQFMPPDTESGNFTTVLVWGQNGTDTVSQFQMTHVIYTLWEASVLATAEAFIPPSIGPGDASLAMRMIISAFSENGPASIARNVIRDDGVGEALIADLKAVWGAGKAAVGSAKAVWGAFKSLFDEQTPEEKASRLINQGLDAEMFAFIAKEVAASGFEDASTKFRKVYHESFTRARLRAQYGDMDSLGEVLRMAYESKTVASPPYVVVEQDCKEAVVGTRLSVAVDRKVNGGWASMR